VLTNDEAWNEKDAHCLTPTYTYTILMTDLVRLCGLCCVLWVV
jgi:hypothetical protein